MRKNIIILIILISILILIISSAILIKDYMEYKNAKDLNENLIKMVVKPNVNVNTNDINTLENEIDWKKLKEINNDIIGWIEFKNININYPILKDNNSLYYLNHTFDKKYNRNGSIFTINKGTFDDSETAIYGHNMKNDIMFSELNKYLESDYFFDNENFIIYTPNKNYYATIFSCYIINENLEEININSLNFEERVSYYQKQSKFDNNIEEIKKIVKLSTCSYPNNLTVSANRRLYIIAKLDEIAINP